MTKQKYVLETNRKSDSSRHQSSRLVGGFSEETDKSKKIRLRKPPWLRTELSTGDAYADIKKELRAKKLHTICEEGKCPNLSECWGGGTATFMILGEFCTRGCRFCSVQTKRIGEDLDPEEVRNIAEAVQSMKLRYVVLTSVDRDDLSDGGAGHFAKTIEEIYRVAPRKILVEVLTPDFQGKTVDIKRVVDASPTVFGHNLETVRRLSPRVRDPRASFDTSLDVLRQVKTLNSEMITKSSLMLGLGETETEILETMDEMREAGVDILTMGQYLQPTTKHLNVIEFIPPEQFDALAEEGRKRGFVFVAAGPLVRSSYRAGELFVEHFVRAREKKKVRVRGKIR